MCVYKRGFTHIYLHTRTFTMQHTAPHNMHSDRHGTMRHALQMYEHREYVHPYVDTYIHDYTPNGSTPHEQLLGLKHHIFTAEEHAGHRLDVDRHFFNHVRRFTTHTMPMVHGGGSDQIFTKVHLTHTIPIAQHEDGDLYKIVHVRRDLVVALEYAHGVTYMHWINVHDQEVDSVSRCIGKVVVILDEHNVLSIVDGIFIMSDIAREKMMWKTDALQLFDHDTLPAVELSPCGQFLLATSRRSVCVLRASTGAIVSSLTPAQCGHGVLTATWVQTGRVPDVYYGMQGDVSHNRTNIRVNTVQFMKWNWRAGHITPAGKRRKLNLRAGPPILSGNLNMLLRKVSAHRIAITDLHTTDTLMITIPPTQYIDCVSNSSGSPLFLVNAQQLHHPISELSILGTNIEPLRITLHETIIDAVLCPADHVAVLCKDNTVKIYNMQ